MLVRWASLSGAAALGSRLSAPGPGSVPVAARRLFFAAAGANRGDGAADLNVTAGLPDKCQNTGQGMLYVADSRGLVCSPFEVDHASGCCVSAAEDPFPCTTCPSAGRCCAVYEYCVACCFRPAQRAAAAAALADVHRRAVPLYAGVAAGDLFRFCRMRCRHSSASTVHENRFRSDQHYCY
eukprot:EG_transcript_34860